MSTKKLQITTPIVTSVNGKTGDVTVPTSSGGFLCTITGSGTDSDPYVCDKSLDEILQAVNDGLIPYSIYSGATVYGDKNIMFVYDEYLYTPYHDYVIFRSYVGIDESQDTMSALYIWKSGKVKYGGNIIKRVASVNGKTGYVQLKTSDLENDSGYLTEHQSLDGYALKTDIPTITLKTWTSSDIT